MGSTLTIRTWNGNLELYYKKRPEGASLLSEFMLQEGIEPPT